MKSHTRSSPSCASYSITRAVIGGALISTLSIVLGFIVGWIAGLLVNSTENQIPSEDHVIFAGGTMY